MLIPCSLDLAKSLILHKKELTKRSPIIIPEDWPSFIGRGILPFYIERLEQDRTEYGWGIWLIIHHGDKKIIGDFYLYSKPDRLGAVAVDFHMHPDYRNQYGFEAASRFLDWLLEKDEVISVTAECHARQEKTIGLFSRLGLICCKRDQSYLSWNLSK
ncbi:GNAT family N-acetyltransferase [Metabacillus mangrovi]|uniref:GNAT family N-acetyltransferase n=1 Tax=Metabacillus mangrovi TaxID=1491830 RepID=UPI0012BAFE7A|nr:GNAT family N-acetyltransferase [Metabacillus mangrovi]